MSTLLESQNKQLESQTTNLAGLTKDVAELKTQNTNQSEEKDEAIRRLELARTS